MFVNHLLYTMDYLKYLFTVSDTISLLVSILLFSSLTFYSWRRFSANERHFFLSSDKDCRDFIKDCYSNPDAPLGNFKEPIYGPNKNISAFTVISGLLFLYFCSVHLLFSFPTMLSIVGALFFAQKLFWFDAKHLFLPDDDVFGFFFSGLIFGITHTHGYPWEQVVLSAISLSLFLWIFMAGFKLFLNKDGMGFGDVKLLLAMTPFLGFLVATHALLIASILGTIWWCIQKILHISKKDKTIPSTMMPFGPFLLIGWAFSITHQSLPYLW